MERTQEGKRNLKVVTFMIAQLLQIAKEKLATVDDTVDVERLPAPQVTVLLTANNSVYVAVNDADGIICETMAEHQDTKVVRMLTMWKDGGVDLSSYRFRVALVEMNACNTDTAIILQGENGLHTKVLGVTITPV